MSGEVATFEEAVYACWNTPELMHEYRRLTGSTLGLDTRAPIERLIDRAAGRHPWDAEWTPFFEFVRDVVWMPLVVSAAAGAAG